MTQFVNCTQQYNLTAVHENNVTNEEREAETNEIPPFQAKPGKDSQTPGMSI